MNTCCLSGVKREKVDAAVVRTREELVMVEADASHKVLVRVAHLEELELVGRRRVVDLYYCLGRLGCPG